MHKHNFGQNLKLQSAVVTLNIRLISSSLINSSRSVSKQCIYASLVEIHPLVQKIDFYSFFELGICSISAILESYICFRNFYT